MVVSKELNQIKSELCSSKNQWRWHTARVIDSIPPGHLATYGYVANVVNKTHGLCITARNVGWLRKYLYIKLTHKTDVPLHRIAKKGDVDSLKDSGETREVNKIKRGEEGSLECPKWLM